MFAALVPGCKDSASPGLFGDGVLYSKAEVAILRTDPSTYGFEVDTIRKGESVKVLERTEKKARIGQTEDHWYLVEKSNHVKGWIFGGTLSVLPTASGEEVVQGPDLVVVQANLPGEWWEVNPDDSTGFRRIKFEPRGQDPANANKPEKKKDQVAAKDDEEKKEVVLAETGKFQYFYGKGAGMTAEYRIDPKTRRIRLSQESPIGQEIEILDLGEDFRLISARGDKKFAFKKGYDTDEEEKKKKEEEEKKQAEDTKPAGR